MNGITISILQLRPSRTAVIQRVTLYWVAVTLTQKLGNRQQRQQPRSVLRKTLKKKKNWKWTVTCRLVQYTHWFACNTAFQHTCRHITTKNQQNNEQGYTHLQLDQLLHLFLCWYSCQLWSQISHHWTVCFTILFIQTSQKKTRYITFKKIWTLERSENNNVRNFLHPKI